ncbi:SPOR domain-containing protein [Oceanobacter sp. 4_MG-2023]|uniref:SPOR domain-containing protein n=1 Tax=Oceanobacter sp. 4_MG-2023 TaxID=3062623 RepID=UPI0027376E84|nr:SPOR domain-containing protein [Oceanobacter sp. 4_MG-2023]MDP2547234.1 SPOR domain-containing protein [Oceanobacter sp. 4_MG-2023]
MSDSSSRIPGWVWITTPTLAIAFVGFVIYLSTLPASDEPGAAQDDARQALQQGIERAKASVTEAVKEQIAREAGEPAYDFYQLLEQQKVEAPQVDAYVSTPKDATVSYEYLLQVGSFRSGEDADEMRANLLLLGMSAYAVEANVNNGTWHRVFVGPFSNRSKLNKAQDILVSNNISPLLIKKPLPATSGTQ